MPKSRVEITLTIFSQPARLDEFDELVLKSGIFLVFSEVFVDLDDLDSWTKLWICAKTMHFPNSC